MLASFLWLGAILALLVIGYVLIAAVLRRYFGRRLQEYVQASVWLVFAVLFEALIMYMSVTFCSNSLKYAMRIRDQGASNDIMQGVLDWAGAQGPGTSSSLGFILPIVTWIVAHVLVWAGWRFYLSIRELVVRHAEARSASSPLYPPQEMAEVWFAGISWLLIGALLFFVFELVADYDNRLARYQIIDNSPQIREIVGDDWMISMSDDELHEVLGQSYLGKIVNTIAIFYPISVVVAGTAFFITGHSWQRAFDRMPQRTIQLDMPPIPPVLPQEGDAGGGSDVPLGEPSEPVDLPPPE